GTAQGIKEAVEDTKEGEETKNREYNEAGEELEDAGDKVKAGAKAVAKKVEDPDKDLDSEYQKEKTEEKMD
ncbi:MAG TPA: hypothetical protein VIP56_02100, partial [Nitrososphaeraceae archaeon]